ncbi:hypothetical protein HDU76_006956, partial [Blyttiomyces sp. JEL0837]
MPPVKEELLLLVDDDDDVNGEGTQVGLEGKGTPDHVAGTDALVDEAEAEGEVINPTPPCPANPDPVLVFVMALLDVADGAVPANNIVGLLGPNPNIASPDRPAVELIEGLKEDNGAKEAKFGRDDDDDPTTPVEF